VGVQQYRGRDEPVVDPLEIELADMRRLLEASSRLIPDGNVVASLDEILSVAIAVCHSDMGAIRLTDDATGELRLLASQGMEPHLVDNLPVVRVLSDDASGAAPYHPAGIRGFQSTPLVTRSGRLLGVISTGWRAAHGPGERQLQLLDVLARQLSDALERQHANTASHELSRTLEQSVLERTAALENLTAQLRHFASELTSAEQRERGRIAAVLHDDLQQLLFAAGLHLRQAEKCVREEAARSALSKASELFEAAGAAARDLAHQLRPPVLYEDGLVPALEWLAGEVFERHGLRVAFEGRDAGKSRVNDDLRSLLFESTRELLFNVVKSAGVDQATIELRGNDRTLELRVSDRGRGFDVPAVMKGAGVGFGLLSIRERITALGGTLTIDSVLGLGTSVALRVPLQPALREAEDEASAEELRGRASQGQPLGPPEQLTRVLVVDDHAIIRQGLILILDDEDGIEVIGEAGDGLAAIAAIERQAPDVVLMDVSMPRMSGHDAAREIRRRWPEIVIIGLSAQDDAATERSMLEAGASAFVPKSGDSDRVIATILKLGRRQSG
jgi:signal transduction histidine kinase